MKTKSKVRDYATRAIEENRFVRGVKGFSILSELPLFDIVSRCVFDILHAVDLGIMHKLEALYFDSK